MNILKKVLLVLSLVFLVLSPLIPPANGMTARGWTALAILAVAVVLWLTNVIPRAVTSMLVIALPALTGILTFEEAASSFGREVIWLLIALLVMGIAIEKTGLDKRIVFTMLSWAKGNFKSTIFFLIIFAFTLNFFVPNAVARVVILLPISLGLIEAMAAGKDSNSAKLIMLTISFIPIITASGLLTGASGSIYAAGLFSSSLGFNFSYLYWFSLMMPIIVCVVATYWLIAPRLFPSEVKVIPGGKEYILEEKKKLGQISKGEIKLLALYIILIILWITEPLHHLSLSLSALCVAVVCFLPLIDLVKWNVVRRELDWGVPIVFSAGFTIADTLEKAGIVDWMAVLAGNYLQDFSPFVMALSIMILLLLIRIIFTNYTAMVASLLPVILAFAKVSPFNPLWLGMIAVLASNAGYLFPSQTVANMITLNKGYFSVRDYFVVGIFLTVSLITFSLLFAFFYWPLLGLDILK
jgi:sodium-dependent dicarboxylate transporter 2/3/5